MIFMQDNTSSYPFKHATALQASRVLKDDQIMTWPSDSHDLSPSKNLWVLLKCDNHSISEAASVNI